MRTMYSIFLLLIQETKDKESSVYRRHCWSWYYVPLRPFSIQGEMQCIYFYIRLHKLIRILPTSQGLDLLGRKTLLSWNAGPRMWRLLPHQGAQVQRPFLGHPPCLSPQPQLTPEKSSSLLLLQRSTQNCPVQFLLRLLSPRKFLRSWQEMKHFPPPPPPRRAGLENGEHWLPWPLEMETTCCGTDIQHSLHPRSTAFRATSVWPTAPGRSSTRPSPRLRSTCRSGKPRSWPTLMESLSFPWENRKIGPKRVISLSRREMSLQSRGHVARGGQTLSRKLCPHRQDRPAVSSPEACRQSRPHHWRMASRTSMMS